MGRPALPRLTPQILADRIMVPMPHEKFVTVDHDDGWVLDLLWCLSPTGYAGTSTHPPVMMHRLISQRMGFDTVAEVDHINMDKLDNRRANLRPADRRLQAINQGKLGGRATSSTYKGVSFHRASNLWRASIKNYGATHSLGYFKAEIDAARAYNEAARRLHGPVARLNDVA